MQKIILGLMIVFSLLACKLPEEAENKDETNIDEFKSTLTKSDDLGITIKIAHEKSVYHNDSNINENAIGFSIELHNELERILEVIESEGDSLQLYINEGLRSLVPVKCGGEYIGLYAHVCNYTYVFESNSVIDKSLHVKLVLSRLNGDMLTAIFDVPAPVQLLEPRIPFRPVMPNGTTLVSWQSEMPVQLRFLGGVLGCFWEDKSITPGEQDTYFQLLPDLFRPKDSTCAEYNYFKMILDVNKQWSQLDGSNFKRVNINWHDSYHVILLGHE